MHQAQAHTGTELSPQPRQTCVPLTRGPCKTEPQEPHLPYW